MIVSRAVLVSILAVQAFSLGVASAQTQSQQPSRKEQFERDGIIWGSAAVWGGPFQEDISEDLKLAGLARFWMEVKVNFPHFAEISELDWDKTYLEFIPRVRATKSTYEYYRVLQQMCAVLKDGHSDVFLPKELAERMEATPPLRLDVIENRVFVTRVESKALESAGVTAGLEVLKIDGVPVREYADKNRRPYVASNSPQHVEVKVFSYGLMAGPRDKPVAVEFRAKDGEVFEKQIARTPYADQTAYPAFEYRKIPGNIAYVAINSFASNDVQKEFEKHLAEIRASDGLVIDVRENDGGSGVVAYNIIGYLVAKNFAPPQWKSREYVATMRAWGTPGGWYEPKPTEWAAQPNEYYQKPVVMLTGPRSLSATDVFAEVFSQLKRGKIVGEATGGSTGDPVAFALPGGGSARVSTSTEVRGGIVGKGVQPDVSAPRTVQDFLAGRDAALEAGLTELKKTIAEARGH
ncbi:MAG TPA: S41 family peptidase [Candidatus Angelobacter sp.]|jgi:C-terminal processing protease CtpA/Prc